MSSTNNTTNGSGDGAGGAGSTKTRSGSQMREGSTMSTKTTPVRDSKLSSSNNSSLPLSPSRITRLQEKEEMQNLNDRLVIYIDTVRRLESENSRLQQIVYSYTESSTRDVSEIKKIYEKELDDAKRLIDELARDKAKCEIEVNKYRSNALDEQKKLDKRDKEAKTLEAKLKANESQVIEFKSRYDTMQAELSRANDELAQLRPQTNELEKQLVRIKKQLEEETLSRIDLENKNQTLKEELQFKAQIYDKETEQLRSSKRVEIEQVDVRLREVYDSKLFDELQRIRDEADFKIREMKDEIERKYHNKYSDVDANLKRSQSQTGYLREEIETLTSKLHETELDYKSLKEKLSLYETKIRDLEEKLKRANAKYEKDIEQKDSEIEKLRAEVSVLLTEYQELHDIKIALDMEISAYRKLLESEEQRLNISTSVNGGGAGAAHGSSFLSETNSSMLASSSTRSGKKRRFDDVQTSTSLSSASVSSSYIQSHESKSGIEISELDVEGKLIRLTNKTDKEISIGHWLLRRCNLINNNKVDFKFPKATVIKPGQHVNIWSSTVTDVKNSPPNDFIMNNQQWFVSDKLITALYDKDANEQARRECEKSVKVKTSPSKISSIVVTESKSITTSSSSSSLTNKLFGGFFNKAN